MENDFIRTTVRLDKDNRLAAAVSAILDHAAIQAGMADARRAALVGAGEQVYREIWTMQKDGEVPVEMVCDQHHDRVEVVLEGPAVGAGKAETALEHVRKHLDRLNVENHAGKLKITLVEYLNPRQ